MTAATLPAAQYLRMSTEHQQYSLSNQADAIGQYAESHGFFIVKTYSDSGRSGIQLKHRLGLQQLLGDVVTTNPGFKSVLVYDVSRWGRFQDADEAAHYEFVCRSAGIPVHYCAEPFDNDGSVTNLLLKTLKRSMAAEYSRELGVKVLAGQKNVYRQGFRGSGGRPGYGLRRMLVGPDGTRKQLLAPGERKSLQSDRVIWVPGPLEELSTIQEICRLFLEAELGFTEIARELNLRRIPFRDDRPWDSYAVQTILTNPKYNGWMVYGRTSRKLHSHEVKLPESEWLRVPHSTCKIIDNSTFGAVKARLASFTINKSNDDLLAGLRAVLSRHGRITSTIVRRTLGMASPASFRHRFGSLIKAYELIGYHVPVARLVVTRNRVQAMRLRWMQDLQEKFPQEIWLCDRGGRRRNYLRLTGGTKISVRFCLQPTKLWGRPAWYMRPVHGESQWTALVVLLNRENTECQRYFVFHSAGDGGRYITESSPWLDEGVECHDLRELCNTIAVAKKKCPRGRL